MIELTAGALSQARDTGAAWRWAAAALLLAGAVSVFAFRAPLVAAVQTWSESPSYEHGYAVVAIAAALIWKVRRLLAREAPQPCALGVTLAAGAAVMATLGAAAAAQVVEQAAFVLFLHAMVLATAGVRVWYILSFPLFYLFFAVPMGDAALPWLRGIASHLIVTFLELGGVHSVLDGYLIRLPIGDFRIAEACSGLRFLLVSLAVGVLAAHLLLQSWRRRFLLLAVAALLPVAANALRSAILIWIAARGILDTQSAAMHLTYGLGLTSILLTLLMMFAWFMRDAPGRRTMKPATFRRPGAPLKILASAGGVAVLALLPMTLLRSEAATGPAHLTRPHVQGKWRIDEPSADLWGRAAMETADARIVAAWTGDSARVELLVLYFVGERQGAEAVSAQPPPEEHWRDDGVVPVWLKLGGGEEIEVQARIERRAGEQRLLCTWYWVGGEFSSSPFHVKLLQLRKLLLGLAAPTARLQLIVAGEDELGTLARLLADLEPLGPVLARAENPRP